MVIGSVIDRLRMAAQLVYCGIAAPDSRTRTTAQRAGLFDRKVRSRRSDRYCVRTMQCTDCDPLCRYLG